MILSLIFIEENAWNFQNISVIEDLYGRMKKLN